MPTSTGIPGAAAGAGGGGGAGGERERTRRQSSISMSLTGKNGILGESSGRSRNQGLERLVGGMMTTLGKGLSGTFLPLTRR